MKPLHRILVLLIFISSTLALTAKKGISTEKPTMIQGAHISFDLFSSLNVFSPRWRIGYIQTIDPKWKAGINLGYGNKASSYTYFLNHFEENYKLWEIRPEIYKVFNYNGKTEKYLSVELFYINHTDVFHNWYYYPREGGEISFDKVDFRRQKYGFNCNVGEFIFIKNGFSINIFTGLGLRMRSSSFTNIVNPRSTETFTDMFDFNEYREKEGLDPGFSYSLGLKLIFL